MIGRCRINVGLMTGRCKGGCEVDVVGGCRTDVRSTWG